MNNQVKTTTMDLYKKINYTFLIISLLAAIIVGSLTNILIETPNLNRFGTVLDIKVNLNFFIFT